MSNFFDINFQLKYFQIILSYTIKVQKGPFYIKATLMPMNQKLSQMSKMPMSLSFLKIYVARIESIGLNIVPFSLVFKIFDKHFAPCQFRQFISGIEFFRVDPTPKISPQSLLIAEIQWPPQSKIVLKIDKNHILDLEQSKNKFNSPIRWYTSEVC